MKKQAVLIIFENFHSQKSAGRDRGQTQGIQKKKTKPSHPAFALTNMQQRVVLKHDGLCIGECGGFGPEFQSSFQQEVPASQAWSLTDAAPAAFSGNPVVQQHLGSVL